MALKLKLKMPSSSASGSPQPPVNSLSPEQHQQSPPKLPKLKIKAPSKTPSTSESTPTVSLKRTAEDKSEGVKPKKLKISLSKNKENGSRPKLLPRVRVKPTRVPGEGYDSEAPDLEDDPLVEQGIIIRFLNDANLDFVHNAVDSGDLTGLNVKWVTREKAVVKINDTLYSARLIDLPTITEIFKTIDRKNVFKTFDICQILLVLHPVEPAQLSIDKDFEVPEEFLFNHPFYKYVKNKEIKRKHLVHKDGLLQPFEDVYRRFRPTRADHRVVLDIESKVDELIKLDNEAEESHFEILDSKTAQQSRFGSSSANASAVSTPAVMRMDEPELTPGGEDNNEESEEGEEDGEEEEEEEEEEDFDDMEDDLDLHLEQELEKALDAGLSDSEVTIPTLMAGILKNDVEEEEGEEGEEVVVDENGNQIEVEEEQDGEEGDEEEGEDDEEESEEGEEDEEEEEEDEEEVSGKQHAKLLEEEIAELEKAVAHHKKNLATASSKMLRMKFQNTYSSLKASLDLKKRDLAKFIEEQESMSKPPTAEGVPDRAEVEQDQEEEEEDEEDDDDDGNENQGEDNKDEDDDDDNIDDIDDLF